MREVKQNNQTQPFGAATLLSLGFEWSRRPLVPSFERDSDSKFVQMRCFNLTRSQQYRQDISETARFAKEMVPRFFFGGGVNRFNMRLN